MKLKRKYYLKKTLNWWLWYHTNIWTKHYTLRHAWKPSFILESYQDRYWTKEWAVKYHEYLTILNSISDKWVSPFVIYENEYNKWHHKKNTTNL